MKAIPKPFISSLDLYYGIAILFFKTTNFAIPFENSFEDWGCVSEVGKLQFGKLYKRVN